MGSDWDAPRDTGPQIEERSRKWKKKRKGKKLFAIEARYIGRLNALGKTIESLFSRWREWHIDRKYETEKQRDTALDNLQRKEKNSTYRTGRWEYRKHGEIEGQGALGDSSHRDERHEEVHAPEEPASDS